jgi:hypothetical protein
VGLYLREKSPTISPLEIGEKAMQMKVVEIKKALKIKAFDVLFFVLRSKKRSGRDSNPMNSEIFNFQNS